MSKSLQVIQTIMKVAKILATVVFVFCIVGGAGCLLGLVATVAGQEMISPFLAEYGDISIPQIYFACISGVVACVGECVLAKFAMLYFEHELKAGTPFTFAGAKEILRLGILLMAIPVASSIVLGTTEGIMEMITGEMMELGWENSFSVTTGALFLVASFVFKHGAELAERVSEGTAMSENTEKAEKVEETKISD